MIGEGYQLMAILHAGIVEAFRIIYHTARLPRGAIRVQRHKQRPDTREGEIAFPLSLNHVHTFYALVKIQVISLSCALAAFPFLKHVKSQSLEHAGEFPAFSSDVFP